MKKEYQKPELIYVNYELDTSVANFLSFADIYQTNDEELNWYELF